MNKRIECPICNSNDWDYFIIKEECRYPDVVGNKKRTLLYCTVCSAVFIPKTKRLKKVLESIVNRREL